MVVVKIVFNKNCIDKVNFYKLNNVWFKYSVIIFNCKKYCYKWLFIKKVNLRKVKSFNY